jgi:MerR family transcriptional regulator/heat shock protein HspR
MAARPEDPDARQGIYGISVAAELTGTGVQTLRQYEQRGLIDPERTRGGTRRYSSYDIHRIERIIVLVGDGLNLRGVARVMALEDENARLRAALKEAAS